MVVELIYCDFFFFFFKQKTAYEWRISDWSSDVCSSDLRRKAREAVLQGFTVAREYGEAGGPRAAEAESRLDLFDVASGILSRDICANTVRAADRKSVV